jgi:hypothetical protein
MSRLLNKPSVARLVRLGVIGAVLSTMSTAAVVALASGEASADVIAPTSASWCTAHGSSLSGWARTKPALPICGPGPAYGGTWQYVSIPGPFGSYEGYFNATPGFQCVELAERYLAVVDGLDPVHANGAQVAMAYHAAYPSTRLVVNGSSGAIGHAPATGDVVSLSGYSGFVGTDGHVAIVTASDVDGAGNGSVTIAQQNVSAADYVYTLGLSSWHLFDPNEPSNALFQFRYAEWLVVPRSQSARANTGGIRLVSVVPTKLSVIVPQTTLSAHIRWSNSAPHAATISRRVRSARVIQRKSRHPAIPRASR